MSTLPAGAYLRHMDPSGRITLPPDITAIVKPMARARLQPGFVQVCPVGGRFPRCHTDVQMLVAPRAVPRGRAPVWHLRLPVPIRGYLGLVPKSPALLINRGDHVILANPSWLQASRQRTVGMPQTVEAELRKREPAKQVAYLLGITGDLRQENQDLREMVEALLRQIAGGGL